MEGKNAKARFLEITLHVRSLDAAEFARIELLLNGNGVGAFGGNPRAMNVPIFEEHGDGGRPATVFGLPYVRHIQPDSRSFLGTRSSRRPQVEKQEQTENDPAYANNE